MIKIIEILFIFNLFVKSCKNDKKLYTQDQYSYLFEDYESNLCDQQLLDKLYQEVEECHPENLEGSDSNSYFGFNIDLIERISEKVLNPSKLLPKEAIAGAFFLAFIFLLIMIELVVSFINLCLCNKRAHLKEHETSSCVKLMFVCYIIYVAFFVVVIVYAALSGSRMKNAFCSLSILPNILTNGVALGEVEFIGVNGINNLYTEFGSQILGVGPYYTDLQNIVNENLKTTGETTFDNVELIQNFYTNQYIESSLSAGDLEYPTLFEQMDSEFISSITEEFVGVYKLSYEIDDLAVNSTNLITTPGAEQSSLLHIENFLDVLNNASINFSYYFERMLNYINYMYNHKREFIAVLITFVSVCLILYSLFVLIIFLENNKGKCYSCKIVIKLFIILLVLLTIIVFLITLFFYLFSIINSSMCNISEEMLNIQDFTPIFSEEDEEFAEILNTCVGSRASGDLVTGLDNSFEFEGLSKILIGVINSNHLESEINSSNGSPNSTEEPLSQTQDILNGTTVPLQSIEDELDALNSLVSCANISFAFVGTNSGEVYSVTNNVILNSNACYNYSQANSLRILLMNAYNNSETVFTNFETKLNNANTDFGTNINDLQTAYSSLSSLLSYFFPTLYQIQDYNQSYEQITNCRIARELLITSEEKFCGGLNESIYLLMIFLFFITYAMFFLNCCFCCLLRKRPDEIKEQEEEKKADQTITNA